MTALDQPQISTKSKKILHSSYTGQKWSIFINYISDLLVTDIMVGETGFEPATLCSQNRCATRLRHSPNQMDAFSGLIAQSLSRRCRNYLRVEFYHP